jgi:hypothetical protein
MTLIGASMWSLSGLSGGTTGTDLFVPMVLMGSGMGSMMMALNTHLLNVAPRDLVGRVTSLTSALQNVVASLAIATFATLLQARIPIHIAEVSAAAAGAPSVTALANATAFAFGDVYRTALIVVAVGWCLVWTLRRSESTPPSRPPKPQQDGEGASTSSQSEYEEREPVLVGH